jgi:F420-0:gamma-glutamyl ligase
VPAVAGSGAGLVRGGACGWVGHATTVRPDHSTLDTYGHLFPSELEALADRLEQARAAALAVRERTQRGPAVVVLGEGAGR